MELPALLQPDKQTSARSLGQVRHDSILRSYLSMRTGVGVLGTALPLLLLLGDWFFVQGTPSARGSLSAYYYSGMRDIFVGCLCVTAFPDLLQVLRAEPGEHAERRRRYRRSGGGPFRDGPARGARRPSRRCRTGSARPWSRTCTTSAPATFILRLMIICQGFARPRGSPAAGAGWLRSAKRSSQHSGDGSTVRPISRS